jgi:hypothetical protein
MDINTERLITAIRSQGFSIPHAGVLGNRLMVHDNPKENLDKILEKLYNTQGGLHLSVTDRFYCYNFCINGELRFR